MDPFTIKEIATAATETMGGDIPNFKGWESAGKSFEKPEVSDFDDLGNDIPDFKKSEMSNHDVGGHLEGRQFGGEREGFDPVSA